MVAEGRGTAVCACQEVVMRASLALRDLIFCIIGLGCVLAECLEVFCLLFLQRTFGKGREVKSTNDAEANCLASWFVVT